MRLIDADFEEAHYTRMLFFPTPDVTASDKDKAMVILDFLKMAKTVEPEQHWIPCSETVTEPDHEVLCCDRYGGELIGWLSCHDEQWLCESDGEIMYDTVAWMEKPEPYKESKEC